MEISETGIQTLLSLPQLKILDVATVQSFNEVELQEISSLVKLRMEYDYGGFDDTNFCNVLKKMPELEILEMNIDLKAHKDEYQVFYGNEFLDLVCGAATVAASQNKELVVQQISPNEFATKLRIAKKNVVPDEVVRTLTLKIAFRERLGLLEDVEDFVQTDLKSHYTVIEEEWKILFYRNQLTLFFIHCKKYKPNLFSPTYITKYQWCIENFCRFAIYYEKWNVQV